MRRLRDPAAAALAALFFLAPVLLHRGWPFSHDGARPISRMAIIAAHWRLGELIPVWASNTAMGRGSPSPILYHKTFTYLSALLFLLTGRAKLSLAAAVFGCMAVAFIGCTHAVRTLLRRRDPLLEAFAGVLYLSTNYLATDLWVRGATAEFAACCLMPLLLRWCFRLLEDGVWSLSLGPILAALFLSHAAIAVFAPIPVALAAAAAMLRFRRLDARWIGGLSCSLLIAALLTAPFLLPMAAFVGYGRSSDFLQAGYTIRTSHLPLRRLFLDHDWLWSGSNWTSFSPQLDLVVALVAPAMALVALCRAPCAGRLATTGFLLSTLLVMLLLQTSWAFVVFDAYPGAAYLQFSWRLETFLTPSLVFLSVLGLDGLRYRERAPAVLLAVALVASTAANKSWWLSPGRPFLSPSDIETALHQTHDSDPIEYFPATPVRGAEPALQAARLLAPGRDRACLVRGGPAQNQEQITVAYVASCRSAASLVLDPFWAPGVRVVENGHGVRSWRSCRDPRVHVAAPVGVVRIEVGLPTWWSTLADLLRGRRFDEAGLCRGQASASRSDL